MHSLQLEFDGVRIVNPAESPNTDGIDIDSCCDVRVRNCNIDVGDDGIYLKSGSGDDGIQTAKPTRRILVEYCEVKNAHGGVVIGSETAAEISDVVMEKCRFLGTARGLRIKMRRGRGGHIHDRTISGVYMEDAICPLTINMYYLWGSNDPRLYSLEKQPVIVSTPKIENITVSNCRDVRCKGFAGFIAGLPEMPVENLTVSNCIFEVSPENHGPQEIEMFNGLPEITAKGIRLRNVRGSFTNVSVNTNPAFVIEDGAEFV